MKKHYETHVEDTDKLISVAGPVLDYKSWYERYRKLMEEQAQRKYGLYTHTSEGDDDFPSFPGITARYSALGLTNEEMSKNPVWVDKTGNGHDLQMKNFAWGGMSGCGGYDYDFTKKSIFNYSGANTNAKIASDTFYIEKVDNARINISIRLAQFKCRLKITGVSDSINSGEIQLLRMYSNKNFDNRIIIKTDGIYDVDIPNQENGLIFIFAVSPQGTIENPLTLTTPITIEQLPLYPGFIIGDGVDDYAVTEKNLDFEDTYTVYTAFIPSDDNLKDSSKSYGVCGKDYAKDFYLRYSYPNRSRFYSVSDGLDLTLSNGFNLIACKRTADKMQFKNLLTGASIEANAKTLVKNPGLYYLWRSAVIASYAKAAIAGQVICNGHFTSDEEDTKVLNWYKKEYPWLFFDQAWTVTGKSNEDTDRAIITNITGNGNNLVLSNFGFAGNSGYGEYAYNWSTWRINKVDSTKSNVYHNRMEITLPAIGESSRTQCNFYSPLCEVGTIYDFSFKISGLTGNSVVLVKPGTNGRGAIITQYNKDGVYHLNYTLTDEAIVGESTQNRIYFFIQNFSDEEMNLTIEQIPDHEGYLVTDGVDDIIKSSLFTIGKHFTVVGDWKLLNNEIVNAGIIKRSSLFIYNAISGLRVFINRDGSPYYVNTKTLRAIVSDGRMYDDNWKEYLDTNKQLLDKSGGAIFIGSSEAGSLFTRLIFKNLAIYPRVIPKEDCIKAYIYLQTLKAK